MRKYSSSPLFLVASGLFFLSLITFVLLYVLQAAGQTPAPQEIPVGVTYVCSGEHIYTKTATFATHPTTPIAWSRIPIT